MSQLRLPPRAARAAGAIPYWMTAHQRADYLVKIFWATPPWLTAEHRRQMRETYRKAGSLCHVDHIVPLKSPLVCGLHVPWNLQLLPPGANLTKSNSQWPDSPHDNHVLPFKHGPHQTRLL